MRITALEIERFGVWEHLYLPQVSKGLNLFYGPNEAGKTTLMQFIRSSLYGCGNPERARYIQMALGPKEETPALREQLLAEDAPVSEKKGEISADPNHWIGGALTVRSDFGQYRLDRRYIRRNASLYDRQTAIEARSGFIATGGLASWSGRFYPIPGAGIAESLIVSGPDGARLSDYFVKTLVDNIDEATFNNVFAIGLDELQRLGTLNETDAAQMLYRLSVGMDRVSLISALHQIVDERNEVFDKQGKPSILEGLLARRSHYIQKSQESSAQLREYLRIKTERDETLEALRLLGETLEKNRRSGRLYELAGRILPLWDQRSALRTEISGRGAVLEIGDDALAEADRKVGQIGAVRTELDGLKREYLRIRGEIAKTKWNDAIWKNAARIENMEEELPRALRLADEIDAKQAEMTALSDELEKEEGRLKGVKQGKIVLSRNVIDAFSERSADSPVTTEGAPEVELSDYRVIARAMRQSRKRLHQTKEQSEEVAERLRVLSEKLDHELSSRGQKNLTEALETTGELVTQLRRRGEVGRRLADMERHRRELGRVNAELIANQSLPTPVMIAVAAAVVGGGVLAVLAFLHRGNVDFGVGLLGALLAAASLFYKTTVERKNYAQLKENQRQLAGLMRQYEQAKEEAASIDARCPTPGQTVEVRLQKAESDLAEFERLVPADAKWKETNHHYKTLENRLEKAQEGLKAAQKRWTNWLKSAGLSANLTPPEIKTMLQRADTADTLRRRLDAKRGELDLLQRERKGIADRLGRVLLETGPILSNEKSPEALIPKLREMLDEVHLIREHRGELIRQTSDLKKKRRTLLATLRGRVHERDAFLDLFGAKSVEQLQKLAARYREHLGLLDRLANLEKQIEAAIGGFCPESELAEIIEDESIRPNIAPLKVKVDERIEALTTEQRQKQELSGRLNEQLAALAARREMIEARFEKAALDVRIGRMAALWQSRAVACKMMEDIRKAYEKERQPETLTEASKLLRRLTGGHYVKIWTPLGEDTLYVDTDEGQTLDVAHLSRGTREQLFIAIRLALAVSFEKHGIHLPLILDDVLVNFDNRRAACAAKMLHEYAEAGRQIFLFTCHQHICRTFLDLETPVFILPDKTEKTKRFRVLLPPSMKEAPEEEPAAPPISRAIPLPEPEPVIEPEPEPKEFAPIVIPEPKLETGPVFVPEPIPEPVTPIAEIILRPAIEPEPEPIVEPEPEPEPIIIPTPEPIPEPVVVPEPIPEPIRPVSEIILRPAAEPEPIVEPEPEPIPALETIPEPAQEPEPEPEERGLGLLDLFLETSPEEERQDRIRRRPLEFTRWDDYFPAREEEIDTTPEGPSPSEERREREEENRFVREFFVRDSEEKFFTPPVADAEKTLEK